MEEPELSEIELPPVEVYTFDTIPEHSTGRCEIRLDITRLEIPKKRKLGEEDGPNSKRKKKKKKTLASIIEESQQRVDNEKEKREKAINLLSKGLKVDDAEIVKEIERGIFEKCRKVITSKYLQLVRDISFNLPANQLLLEQLRNGTFDPTKVCDLSIEDLATDQMKKRRKSTLLKNIDSVIYKDEVFVDSGGMFTCPRCRSKETVYVPKNLKSRGTKNETWGNKEEADEARVLVKCKKCNERWTTSQ